MLVMLVAAVCATSAFAVYVYMNRHKPLKHVLRELRNSLEIQGAGAGGLIDDWINITRNKVEIPDATDRIAVITGGARGIGTEVIRNLLQANMTVIMGVRKPEMAEPLRKIKNGENLHVYQLDLESLKSVREFAALVLKNFPKLHLLICNAGTMYGDYKLTEDCIESQFAVNHLSHFYLTHLLLPALKQGGTLEEPSRVVNVSSCAHYPGKIYFEDINMMKHYDSVAAYSQSKLAQLMSARYINKILEDEGHNVKCYSVHPGIVNTDLFERTIFNKMKWLTNILFKKPEKGATPILFACFNKELINKGGLYISNCIEGISNKFSKNVNNQIKLFELSCEMTKIDTKTFGKQCTN